MAYPNPILSTNIGITKDFLEYFKGCLIDYQLHLITEDYDENWILFINQLQSLPAFPVSRDTFYGLIRDNFPLINGAYIYTHQSPISGWSVKMCNDWGKLKVIEQALFGNTTGGAGNSMASVNGTKFLQSIPKWTSASITYLRFGLCRFNSYGAGVVPGIKRPAPTSPVTNVPSRTFNWTNALGYSNLSDYEYIYPDATWTAVTQKPIVIPGNIELDAGDLQVRTKGGGYVTPSDSISNSSSIPYNASLLEIRYCIYNESGLQGAGVYTEFYLDVAVSVPINIRYDLFVNDDIGFLQLTSMSAGFNYHIAFFPHSSAPSSLSARISQVTPNPAGGRWIMF